MDNNPGDSSSESDISDPWSLIDRDSCDTDVIPGGNSRVGSVCGELSDGESLEVIDEDQHEGEFLDTDGVSIITDSEINEELEQTLPAALSKEKKYLHHPNTYLNTRLNVLLALSFAFVTGLGVGHFLGLHEECPLLDTALTVQLDKLQQENEFLQHKLNHLLHEGQVSTNYRDGDLETMLGNNGINLHPSLGLKVKELPSQQINKHTEHKHLAEFGYGQLTHVNHGPFLKVVQNNRDIIENEINSNIMKKQKENALVSTVLVEEKEDVIEDTLLDEYSVTTNDEADDDIVIELKDFSQDLNNQLNLKDERKSYKYIGNVDDSDVHNRLDTDEKMNNIVEIKGTYEDMEKRNDMNGDENVINIIVRENDLDSSFMIEGEENFIKTSSDSNDKFIYPLNNEDMIISEEHVSDVNANSQQNHIYPEALEDAVEEESLLSKNKLQIIKSTLKLLKVNFDKSILSADTESVLSSAIALTMEHEQSLVHLQNTIIECKVRNDNFCVQFHKRMEVSSRKLKKISEQLADDIDEQLHKLLTRIVRKLKKLKNNVQDKWCHLRNGHDNTNDWLESSVLLDCKRNDKKEYNLKSKRYRKLSKSHVKNLPKYDENHQNSEMMVDQSFVTEAFSEHNIKQSTTGKDDKQNHERILQKNWKQNKHNMKDSFKKDKKKREGIQNLSQNQKIKFHRTKSELDNNQKKTITKRDTLRKENMNPKHYVILDQSKTWPTLNIASSKQNNVSGDWILKLADGRAEQRKINHRSDWVFDRADARKIKRKEYQMKGDWYFQRARGREDCRYSSFSDWCKDGNPNDWYHKNKHENEKQLPPQTNRWSKKFARTFTTAGKWVKDSFSRFQNKMNYHYH